MRDPFERLEPPAGGLTRLRAALDEAQRAPRGIGWRVPASAIALLALVGVVSMLVPRAPAPVTFDSPSLIALGLERAPDAAVAARDGTAVELVSASPQVVFYRAGSWR